MENKIRNFLELKISFSWYKNSEIDYGVTGKFLKAEFDNNNLKITHEEMGKIFETIIPYYNEYTLEQLYNIWMEGGWQEVA